MARRGLFAEYQHQVRLVERERARAERIAVKEHQAAIRLAEQTRRASERFQAELARANAAEKRRLEKEARESYIAAKEAEVDERNKNLQDVYSQIDSLLAATLNVDDFVDLDRLRVTASHPPFDKPGLKIPIPFPAEIPFPPAPVYVAPDPPRGVSALFGKAKYEAALASSKKDHQQALAEHQRIREQILIQRKEALAAHARAESERLLALTSALEAHAEVCKARDVEASANNKRLDDLIANLGYGTPDAVQEYVSIVLANSVYPECFPVSHDFSYDPSAAELTLRVLVPSPDKIPTVKAYKYSKSADEITETALSQKVCRERYEAAVHQVALRSIHEVFEADRRSLIRTISLTVGTEAVSPATGHEVYVPLVVAGAERESFLSFDLSAVDPEATLKHLGSSLSKSPFSLMPAETAGVRRA